MQKKDFMKKQKQKNECPRGHLYVSLVVVEELLFVILPRGLSRLRVTRSGNPITEFSISGFFCKH